MEGEFIPVRNEELDLGNIDGLLLLPITIEHTIDERSPLCGHTYESLKALNAEIVVTFEGTTEMGAHPSARPLHVHAPDRSRTSCFSACSRTLLQRRSPSCHKHQPLMWLCATALLHEVASRICTCGSIRAASVV